MSNDSIGKTLTVAVLLSLVCSIIVSSAAVILKPLQEKNELLYKQKNILSAAGLLSPGQNVANQFSKIEKRIVDIKRGEFVTEDVDVENYDQRKAKKDPKRSVTLNDNIDIASLKRRAKYAEVYLVNDSQGNLQTLILPVSGYGLWSTLYGFMALEKDLNTVVGLTFYDHAETPGLGGEVDNPKWQKQWIGKKIFNDIGEVVAKLKKGGVDPTVEFEKKHYVDGLSGATLTSNGVNNLIQFWLGENGFGPFIDSLSVANQKNTQATTQESSR
jgi:Na+-transporting NADH:ubiquinone oxidoreductase subunit C